MGETAARQSLLEAGSRLFYVEGIAATSVDAVAREAGVSKPTLYAHFPSKTHLVVAVLERRRSALEAELQDAVTGLAPGRRPLAAFAWLADSYDGAGARGCAFVNAAAEVPDSGDPVRRVVTAEKAWLRAFLTALVADAGLTGPERLGSQLLLLLDGVSARVLVEGRAADAVRDAEAAAAELVAAAGPASA